MKKTLFFLFFLSLPTVTLAQFLPIDLFNQNARDLMGLPPLSKEEVTAEQKLNISHEQLKGDYLYNLGDGYFGELIVSEQEGSLYVVIKTVSRGWYLCELNGPASLEGNLLNVEITLDEESRVLPIILQGKQLTIEGSDSWFYSFCGWHGSFEATYTKE